MACMIKYKGALYQRIDSVTDYNFSGLKEAAQEGRKLMAQFRHELPNNLRVSSINNTPTDFTFSKSRSVTYSFTLRGPLSDDLKQLCLKYNKRLGYLKGHDFTLNTKCIEGFGKNQPIVLFEISGH